MKSLNYKIILLCGVIVSVLLFSGCTENILDTKQIKIIKTDEIFEDDFDELTSHRNIESCGFNIINIEKAKTLTCSYEIWENGKMVGVSHHFIAGVINECDVFISIQKIGNDLDKELKLICLLSKETGWSSVSPQLTLPESLETSGRITKEIGEVIDYTGDEDIPIWAYLCTNEFRPSETIIEAAQKAEWGLVFKIKIEDDADVLVSEDIEINE